jgi:hypothetical protein
MVASQGVASIYSSLSKQELGLGLKDVVGRKIRRASTMLCNFSLHMVTDDIGDPLSGRDSRSPPTLRVRALYPARMRPYPIRLSSRILCSNQVGAAVITDA